MSLRKLPNSRDAAGLSREELVAAAEHALHKFTQCRPSSSLTSISATILFEALIRNIRLTGQTSTIPVARRDFRNELVSRDTLAAHADKSRDGAADDFADEISKFKIPPITFRATKYVITFNGPTPRGTKQERQRGDLVFEMMLSPVGVGEASNEASRHPLHGLRRRCFCCNHPSGAFDLTNRFCGREGCSSSDIVPGERDLYVTVFPERETKPSVDALPDFNHPYDFFAIRGITGDDHSPRRPPLSIDYPFREDHLSNLGLRLGRPTMYRLPQLETASGFSEVHVLDLSTYLWTNTLKDPKSWAVVNAALDDPSIQHLVAYTAGNAGLSLAKVAYAANRAFGHRRLRVYALVDETIGPEIRAALQAWQAEVIDLPRDPDRPVISERTVWRQLSYVLTGVRSPEPVEGAWHVSDGWDGVGVTMYRLLFAQVLKHCEIDYVIAPVGTGNLLLGAQLGIGDVRASHVRMIAALPAGENILENCRIMKIPRPFRASAGKRAEAAQASKLVGRYTPLMPCIAKLIDRGDIDAVEVSRPLQVTAAKWLWHPKAEMDVAAEPSALVAFGALLGAGPDSFQHIVRTRERTRRAPEFASAARVLVVNTGSGVISTNDATFLSGARAGLRGDEIASL